MYAIRSYYVERVATDGYLRNKMKALDELVEREQLATTAIGGGMAIPHVFTDEARRPLMIMARSVDVITSYSIHYTKLYEETGRCDVITAYSCGQPLVQSLVGRSSGEELCWG